MRTKLSTPVYDIEGNVTTLAALLDAGRAIVTEVPNFYKRGNGTRAAYFCDLLDANGKVDGSFEIGKYAFESRKEEATQ